MEHPEKLGQYPITGVIGQGSMGVVYKGFDPLIQRPVAIKVVRGHLLENPDSDHDVMARFRLEAQAAGRLNHPGIVSVYQYGQDENGSFIVMEYVEGHTLRAYLVQTVRFSRDDVLSLMIQLLDALAYAHAHGVLHRDIKPANLIIARAGKLKIADFGVARLETSNLTRVNAVIGSPGYMAPEQYVGKPVDARADLFSAGVLFYQLMTGTLPFTGGEDAVMYKIVFEPHLAPSQLPGAAHWSSFDTVIAKALAKDPDHRFQNADEFRRAVIAAAGAKVPELVSDETIFHSPPRIEPASAANTAANTATPPPQSGSLPASGSQPATVIDQELMNTVERELSRFVGPVARVLVRRAAVNATDIGSLRMAVATSITSHSEQQKFLNMGTGSRQSATVAGYRKVASEPIPSSFRTGGAQVFRSVPITVELIEQVVKLLSREIGPIARVVVRKHAGASRDAIDLIDRLLRDGVGQDVAARIAPDLRRLIE